MKENKSQVDARRVSGITQSITAILLIVSLHSCQTSRNLVPTISATPRSDLNLKNPIIISFKDSRTDAGESREAIESLQQGLSKIYGTNVVFKSYFEKTDPNSVTLKVDIKKIGADFGTRTIQYQTYRNQITALSSSVKTHWGSAVSIAIISQPIEESNVMVQGYWVGTSYLEISLVDNLRSDDVIHEFPFAAEALQSNMLGYKSASTAAQKSWDKVSSGLIDLIDTMAIQIIERE